MRPLVGVTAGSDQKRSGHFSLRQDYFWAVEAAGGLPVILAPGAPGTAADLLQQVQALVLSGGEDVDPAYYREPPHATVTQVAPERDAFELALCREASAEELAEGTTFLKGQIGAAREAALADFCQVLFCLNEFLYTE